MRTKTIVALHQGPRPPQQPVEVYSPAPHQIETSEKRRLTQLNTAEEKLDKS